MVARSQNGYLANRRDLIATYTVPGTSIRLPVRKGDVAIVLIYVAERFDREVEKLHDGWCWGYAERTIQGSSTTLSNHASGTAIDLNAPAHWLGSVGTFSRSEQRAIRRILRDCLGVVRWGGDYSGRKDEMHFEINQGPSAVASLAKKITDASGAVEERSVRNSVGTTKRYQLAADVWNTVQWDKVYGGDALVDHPGIIWGRQARHYSVSVKYGIAGLADGAAYEVRLVEMVPDGVGGWEVADMPAADRRDAFGGTDAVQKGMLARNAEAQAEKGRVWFQVKPSAAAVLEYADAKAEG